MLQLLGSLDCNWAWNGDRLLVDADFDPGAPLPGPVRGAATSVRQGVDGAVRIMRDPLGINKLFWVRERDTTFFAARPRRLIDEGFPLAGIHSFPRGNVLDALPGRDPTDRKLELGSVPNAMSGDSLDLAEIGARILRKLLAYVTSVLATRADARVFVCLSGGLDSSGVAALAAEACTNAVAVSFDIGQPNGSRSEDRVVAERLARTLGMPLLEATASEGELLDHLDTVLVEGVDWRDFNVHAALVNAAMAATIRDAVGTAAEVVVLTGDLANEFLVDYQPEVFAGRTFYPLPRVQPQLLRKTLLSGLDTSHREVGVFGAWGLPVVQPYAVLMDDYLALPEMFLRQEDRKQVLARAVFGDRLPEWIYARRKVRAQMGGPSGEGGVLATCLAHGIDGDWLRRRFARLHGLDDPHMLDGFIRAGRYRTGLPFSEGRTP